MDLILEVIPKQTKYEPIFEWNQSMKNLAVDFWTKNAKPSKKFDLLTHGDCFMPNILFKYKVHP